MAILVNIGQRGFVLKEGLVVPGQQITVDQETAEKLSRVYPNELKLVMQDKDVVEEILQAPVKEEPKEVEEPKPVVEEEAQKPARRGRKKAK